MLGSEVVRNRMFGVLGVWSIMIVSVNSKARVLEGETVRIKHTVATEK